MTDIERFTVFTIAASAVFLAVLYMPFPIYIPSLMAWFIELDDALEGEDVFRKVHRLGSLIDVHGQPFMRSHSYRIIFRRY